MTRVWLVLVPLEGADDIGGAVLPGNIRSAHASAEGAERACREINRREGRRGDDVRAWVEDHEVTP